MNRDQTPNDSKNNSKSPQFDTIIQKINSNSEQIETLSGKLSEIKDQLEKLNSKDVENDEKDDSEDFKYKKVLKTIDFIALTIILFVIVDGVFNKFGWLYAISEYITNLF